MKTNIVIDISLQIPYLVNFWVSSYEPKCYQPIKLQDSLKCNISRKKWTMKYIFGKEINIKVFYKAILPFYVCTIRHAQSTQNNKFTTSLQYHKKNVKDEVDFLLADKCQRFLQSDTAILGVCGQPCPNWPK